MAGAIWRDTLRRDKNRRPAWLRAGGGDLGATPGRAWSGRTYK